MLCKWCGMNSATTDQCSWCHHPFSTGASESAASESAAVRPEDNPNAPAEDAPVGLAAGSPRRPAPPAPPARRPIAQGARLPEPIMASDQSNRDSARRLPAPAILPPSGRGKIAPAAPSAPRLQTAPAPILAAPSSAQPSASLPPSFAPTPAAASAPATPAEPAKIPAPEFAGLAQGVAAPRAAPSEASAALGAGTAADTASKYYPGQTTGASPADTPAPDSTKAASKELEIEWDGPETTMTTLVIRYLLAFMGILAISALLAHAYNGYYVAVMLVSLFCSGMLLPIMNVVPKQRDDSDDVIIYGILILIFGPAISLIIYAVIGLLKRSVNPALVGCLIVSVLTSIVIALSASPTVISLGPPWVQPHAFDLGALFINWSAFAALAGWFGANIFHRFDE